ncbi:NUDIX domain-containing protein [Chloroflexota bacterium]
MKAIRNSAKAIIINNGCLLTVKLIDSEGEWYLLPGGGQNPGETLNEALRRECIEEIGIEVSVGRLRYFREYIGKNHEFSERDGDSHQVEFMFECEFDVEQPPVLGNNPDAHQVDITWLPINEIHEYRIYSKQLGDLHLLEADNDISYLGDVS